MSPFLIVLGGGSAGFLAAITVKRRLPQLSVTMIRSPEISIIGVGEGTTPVVATHLHGYLKIDPAEFYREAEPTWKLGIRFLWGPRPYFNYTFTFQFDSRLRGCAKPNGYYLGEEESLDADLASVLMSHDRVFARQPNGAPLIGRDVTYHLENEKLVGFLEKKARELGVEIVEDTVEEIRPGPEGIGAFQLRSGREMKGELYVDCSGFRSLLLGGVLEEPFESFSDSLLCDRAVVGGWDRAPEEPILPYTTSETMQAGWCWRIDHERRINRGYVYASEFLDDAAAETEFREKNPRVGETRVVRYRSGRYRRAWVKNVVAIGNAGGFVEPLEATALGVICDDSQALAETLADCDLRPNDPLRRAFNDRSRRAWESIRNFLAIHYRFNRRLDAPFWETCRETVALHGAEPIVEFYRRNGPSILWRETMIDPVDQFRLEGYYTLLLGQGVPHERPHCPTSEERDIWRRYREQLRAFAANAFTVEEALALVRSPHWSWTPGFYDQPLDRH